MDSANGAGQSLELVKDRGFAPGPRPGGSASWTSAKGSGPWNPLMGFVLRGGPTRTLRGHGRPSPENKPQLIDRKGPRPLLGVQGAKPPGGSRAEPGPSPVQPIARWIIRRTIRAVGDPVPRCTAAARVVPSADRSHAANPPHRPRPERRSRPPRTSPPLP